MNTEKFEAQVRLQKDFTQKWMGTPDITSVRLNMFRKRNKPLSWRPIIHDNAFLFHGGNEKIIKQIFEGLPGLQKSMQKSVESNYYTFKNSPTSEIAKNFVKNYHQYPFGFQQFLEDLEEFRSYREGLRIKHNQWVLPSVGATIFYIDLDSISEEELINAYNSGLLTHFLKNAKSERIFLFLMASDPWKLPEELWVFMDWGIFAGGTESFAENFRNNNTYTPKPLIARDPVGKYYREDLNELGNIYEMRYSLRPDYQKVLEDRKKEAEDFIKWIEAKDSGN